MLGSEEPAQSLVAGWLARAGFAVERIQPDAEAALADPYAGYPRAVLRRPHLRRRNATRRRRRKVAPPLGPHRRRAGRAAGGVDARPVGRRDRGRQGLGPRRRRHEGRTRRLSRRGGGRRRGLRRQPRRPRRQLGDRGGVRRQRHVVGAASGPRRRRDADRRADRPAARARRHRRRLGATQRARRRPGTPHSRAAAARSTSCAAPSLRCGGSRRSRTSPRAIPCSARCRNGRSG